MLLFVCVDEYIVHEKQTPRKKARTSSCKPETSTVKFYNVSREFGYITPDDGGKDIRFTKRCIASEISLSKICSSARVPA